MTFLFEFVFFIYWSERHFKGIIIIYWCNLIGATCLMAPVKIGFHSLDWFEPRTAYRRGGRKKKKKKPDNYPECLYFHWKLIFVLVFLVPVFIFKLNKLP